MIELTRIRAREEARPTTFDSNFCPTLAMKDLFERFLKNSNASDYLGTINITLGLRGCSVMQIENKGRGQTTGNSVN